jgi:stage V sporulation protein R
LTRDLVEELDLFLYKKVGNQWQVTDTNWEKVRDGLVGKLTNCGVPYIKVEDGDYNKTGDLYLKHYYDGQELDVPYLEKTLSHVYTLWGRPVHIETLVDNKPILFSYSGLRNFKKML